MKLAFWVYSQYSACLILFASIISEANSANAQASNIVPDDTLGNESSQVIENFSDRPIEVITGGAQREQNLFHSFQEFNVSEGRSAYFNSPNADIRTFSKSQGSSYNNLDQ
ncbi:MAG: hypothetical protein QNJ72_42890 [Pleurocapsa sp. MO_226.B13]|nr:hypothetical protein [Pleurocapsa sp. MO_226.B13]